MKINNKKSIKNFFERKYLFFLLIFIGPFLFFKKKIKKRTKKDAILITKLDAIGDYIIFRNFLREIKLSEKYKNYELVFLGNQVVAPLATWLDSTYVDKFIFVDKKKLRSNPFYFFKTLLYVGNDYTIAIQPTFSRDIISDLIIKVSNAKERLSFVGDVNNISLENKNISDFWYTNLIKIKDEDVFEFDRERLFIEQIIEKKIKLAKPVINLQEINYRSDNFSDIPNKYAVIFPGAGANFRRWPVRKMADLAHFLKKEYRLEIVIAGSKSDIIMGRDIKDLWPKDNFIDFTGRTDLKQLVILISKAELLVTNDTCAAHIGSALNVKTIVLSQFNHFGRFMPYPANSVSSLLCVYPDIYKNLTFRDLVDKFSCSSEIDINLVSLEKVKETIKNNR